MMPRLLLLLFLLLALLAGCDRPVSEPVIDVKKWASFMLTTDGPSLPTPRSMAAGPNDELAVLDTAGRVTIFDAEHQQIRQWKMLDVQFGKPEGITWLRDGRLIVCDTHYQRLVWFDAEGRVLRTVGQRGKGDAEFIFPVGICKDAEENLYVCEYGGNDRVQVFTREGQWLRTFGSAGTGPAQFQRPSGLAWHEGRLFVTDAGNNRVHIFQDDGRHLGILGDEGKDNSRLTLDLPYDISLGRDGALYIIEYGAGRLTRASLDGRLLGRYGRSGTGRGEFGTPWGLTSDTRMRVMVADTKNRRIVTLGL